MKVAYFFGAPPCIHRALPVGLLGFKKNYYMTLTEVFLVFACGFFLLIRSPLSKLLAYIDCRFFKPTIPRCLRYLSYEPSVIAMLILN